MNTGHFSVFLRWTWGLGVVILTLFPFYWAILSSLKTGTALFQVDYFPWAPTLENFKKVLSDRQFGRSMMNSFWVATGTVSLGLILALFAAFPLSRCSFRGRKSLLFSILAISMFPQVAILSGMFELIRTLGLYNSHLGLIISYLVLVLPFMTWVLTSFMSELPKELEEAAILDGCSPLRMVISVFFPVLLPSVVATSLLAFIAAWNEFLFALTFILSAEKRTIPIAIAFLGGHSKYELPWGQIMAASLLVTLPLIVTVFIFQKKIISGLTAGAVKG
jgi:trehalose/maltose transport system permease protein